MLCVTWLGMVGTQKMLIKPRDQKSASSFSFLQIQIHKNTGDLKQRVEQTCVCLKVSTPGLMTEI